MIKIHDIKVEAGLLVKRNSEAVLRNGLKVVAGRIVAFYSYL
jgi:hypothetical protein